MLANFTVRRTFCKLRVSLTVDNERAEVSGIITYDRRIVRLINATDVAHREVATPALAERWLSKDMGERGTLIEHLEWEARTGRLAA